MDGSGRSGAANSTAETPYMPNREHCLSHNYLPSSTLICRPAIVSAAHKDGSVIGLHPGIGQIPRGYYPCGRRADQPDRCRPELGPACLVRRDRQPWGQSGVCIAPMSRSLAPPKEGRGPWCELGRGPTLKQLSGPYRRMEVITMTVVAILIAAGVVALVYVGLFFVVIGFFFAMFALDTMKAPLWRSVHSRHR